MMHPHQVLFTIWDIFNSGCDSNALLQTEYITQGDHSVSTLAHPQRVQQPIAPFNNVWSSCICKDRLIPNDCHARCGI